MTNLNKKTLLSQAFKAHNKRLVSLERDALNALAVVATSSKATPPDWDACLPQNLQASQSAQPQKIIRQHAAYFLFVQCALQYCFWEMDDGKPQHWWHGDKKGSGGCTALTIELYEKKLFPGLHLTDLEVTEKLWPFVEGMPLASSRLAILAELADYGVFLGRVYQPIMRHKRVTTEIAAEMAEAFPQAFADPFLKKAQLFLGMLVSNMKARGVDLEADITTFADYRLPQILRHMGVLKYAPQLAQKVDSHQLLEEGSDEEVSIRAAMLRACYTISLMTGLSDLEVDAWLFGQTRSESFESSAKPFHLTRTTNY